MRRSSVAWRSGVLAKRRASAYTTELMSSTATRPPLHELWFGGATSVRRRFVTCLLGALGLHASFTLLGFQEKSVHALPARPETLAPTLIPIAVTAPVPGPGPAPGGGSEDPDPKDSERATPEVPEKRVDAPRVPKAPKEVTTSDLAERAESDPNDDVSASDDLLTALSGPPLTRPARVAHIESRKVTSTTRVAAKQSALRSRSRGYGPGAYGGPGGPGAGFQHGKGGIVRQAFAFGGPQGAFRAEVCFIKPWTPSLKQMKPCRPQVVFFTNSLDVAPRKFNEGFPGVTTRTEWFAIRYRGVFRVRVSDYYKFRIVSDDGSLLHIDGHLIIDNDGQHPPAYKEATIPLEQGEHELYVEYYQGPRDNIALQLFVAGSNGEQKLLGPVI